jgi:hypothetical protein
MGHPSVSGFFQTQFPIKNTCDGSPIHREMPCHYSSNREAKLLQKALKSRAQWNQRSSRAFFVVAGKIAGFESREPILDGRQWNHIILKCTHKFLVDEFAPVSFETDIFHHHSLFDSIHLNIQSLLYRIYPMPINKYPQCQTLWTDFFTEHIWLIQKLIKFRGCVSAIHNSQS